MKRPKDLKQIYHANVPEAWSNDPNGMIWFRGKAHLFCQYYPYKPQWGPMHWGHFVSEDFVKWEFLPVALAPDQSYEAICGCCSGSSMEIDGKLWLMYTAAQPELQRQCLAWSEDGIHFTKLENNPILTSDMLRDIVSPRDFRDPKLFRKGDTYYCLAGVRVIDPESYRRRIDRITSYDTIDEASYYKDTFLRDIQDLNPSGGLEISVMEAAARNISGSVETEPETVSADQERRADDGQTITFNPSQDIPVLGGDEGAIGKGNLILFKTKDLENWEFCGVLLHEQEELEEEFFHLNGVYECPDYFHLGDQEIILASPQNLPQLGNRFQNLHSVIYMTGHLDFEKGRFHIDEIQDLDSGFDIYASQTLETPDHRRILIAWKEMWDRSYPTEEYNWVGSYTLPRELEYHDGHLYQIPVRELEAYREGKVEGWNIVAGPEGVTVDGVEGNVIELEAEIHMKDASKAGVRLFKGTDHETLVCYDKEKGTVYFDRTRSGIPLKGKEEDCNVRACDVGIHDQITLRIFLDVTSAEVFINGGRYVMTGNVYPDENDTGIEFFSDDNARIAHVVKYDIVV